MYGDNVKVILKGHFEEYASREIINSYFPKVKIEFVNEIPENEDYILSEVFENHGEFTFVCTCSNNGKLYKAIESYNRYSKNNIKRSISHCLNKVTDIYLPWGILTGIRPSKIVREFYESDLLKSDYNSVDEYLKSEYEVSQSKTILCTSVENFERKIIKDKYKNGISLYIGIPFCPTRCLYCSFTSQSIAYSNKLTEPYTQCLIREIEEISKCDYIKNHTIESVYFGGGTPTALNANQIEMILTSLFEHFDLSKIREFTFEAGRPDTVTEEKLNILKNFNISRISINPQTSNNNTLELIGRKHSYKQFVDSYKLARKMGFKHINCDIIAGLPNETAEDFHTTITNLCMLDPESITVHTLSIKHGSFLDMKYNMYSLSTANTVNTMLNTAYKTLSGNNMIPYYMYRQKNMLGNLENVGYCKPGRECIYNIYIMEEVQSIVALGGGASTKIITDNSIERIFNVKEVSEYINRIDEMIEKNIDFLNMF